jgi:uncharacterized protein Yka (UPF0111/DUF47 family)
VPRRPSFLRSSDDELDRFEQGARNAARAAEALEEMVRGFPDTAATGAEIRELEHEGDRITHALLREAGAGELAREDVLQLASAIDDVVDLTEEVADYLVLYRIEAPTSQAETLARILRDSCREVALGLAALRAGKDVSAQVIEVHRLENEGDRVSRDAIASLFEAGVDPLFVIRWKDLYERLEDAIDATERVAVVLEAIVIKGR